MDFKHQTAAAAALSKLSADALLLIIGSETLNADLDPALAGPIRDAIANADFTVKAGHTIYLHKLAGVKAPRVIVAAATGATPKAFKAAVGAGITQLKTSGAKTVAVVLASRSEEHTSELQSLV